MNKHKIILNILDDLATRKCGILFYKIKFDKFKSLIFARNKFYLDCAMVTTVFSRLEVAAFIWVSMLISGKLKMNSINPNKSRDEYKPRLLFVVKCFRYC